MEDIKEDILKRTYHIQSLCNDAETTGIETVVALADQGEQIRNIKSSLSSVDVSLIDTKQNINRLKGITQRLIDSIRRTFHQNLFPKITLHSTKKSNSSSSFPRRLPSSPPAIQPNTPSTQTFFDEQIDETFYEIEKTLHRLKDIAQDMTDQLVGQNDTINDINEHMTKCTISIEQQNTDMKKTFS